MPEELTAEEAVALVQPGDRGFVGSACAVPRTLLAALEARRPLVPGVRLMHFLADGTGSAYPQEVFFVGSELRGRVRAGEVDYVPLSSADLPALIAGGRPGRRRADPGRAAGRRGAVQPRTSVSFEEEVTFLAVVGDWGSEQIVGTASYFLDRVSGTADVAYMVDPSYKGLGLDTALQERLISFARDAGVRAFTADVLAESRAMLQLFRSSALEMETHTSQGVTEVVLSL